jgi:Zn-dependent protease
VNGGDEIAAGGAAAPSVLVCAGCGLEVPAQRLACPRCRRLIHGAALSALAKEADAAAAAGDQASALASWRRALALLPPDSQQHVQITAKIETLGRVVEGGAGASPARAADRGKRGGPIAGLGVLGAALWKFKFLAVLVLTKAKFLLLGFTKIGTVLSALAMFGVYWTLWGWRFALGFVVSIYVHEMGHVAALRRYGIAATAPMFIPGLGAFVRLKQNPANAREDARIALAGPLWGLGAAVAAWIVGWCARSDLWMALAHAGALLNLFNLVPLWTLDGGRAFRSLDRRQRWMLCAVFATVTLLAGQHLIILLLMAGVFRALSPDAAEKSDRGAFWLFVIVTVALAVVAQSSASIAGTP